ncbi:MAG: hypothetical protein AAFV95_01455 [Bacteroidota bacterium]
MKIKAIIFGIFALVCTFSYSADAQTTPRVGKRQVTQQKRINQGVKSGELTKKEATRLQAQQVNIQRTKKRAKADGVVTKKERAVINRKQNRASRNINKQKNDAQNRY